MAAEKRFRIHVLSRPPPHHLATHPSSHPANPQPDVTPAVTPCGQWQLRRQPSTRNRCARLPPPHLPPIASSPPSPPRQAARRHGHSGERCYRETSQPLSGAWGFTSTPAAPDNAPPTHNRWGCAVGFIKMPVPMNASLSFTRGHLNRVNGDEQPWKASMMSRVQLITCEPRRAGKVWRVERQGRQGSGATPRLPPAPPTRRQPGPIKLRLSFRFHEVSKFLLTCPSGMPTDERLKQDKPHSFTYAIFPFS
ncbi:hypothetical protein E2C01_039867 [Portunus trituberculatus]|uniref:Uncharacterized protein n=1 Tax=Portunus trituberculatus TaxID=210409 RepID=A0A5B7FME1_PORTR|nr:hypothetical protein [Portunus trituberculatus]